MASCSKCNHELITGAKFCNECGAAVIAGESRSGNRKMEYVGKIRKCPSCGENLPAFTAVCPSCGHELTAVAVESTLSSFIHDINELDERIALEPRQPTQKKGWSSWGGGMRTMWVFLNLFTAFIPLVIYLALPLFRPLFGHRKLSLSPIEQKKAAMIENYAFPNEREAILEALMFTKSKMTFLAAEKYSPQTAYWMGLWDAKAAQLHQKAQMVLGEDAVAESTYAALLQSRTKVRKQARTRAILGAGLIVLYVALVLVTGSVVVGLPNMASPFVEIFDSVPDFSLFGNEQSDEGFILLDTGLSIKLPAISGSKGDYSDNSDTELSLRVEGITYDEFEAYVAACKAAGFTENAVKETSSYRAYDNEGYYLNLYYWGYNGAEHPLDIDLLAPVSGDESFTWPSGVLAEVIPELECQSGLMIEDTEQVLEMELFGVEWDHFGSFIQQCQGTGFVYRVAAEDYKATRSFSGFHQQGYHISADLNEVGKVVITVKAPLKMGEISWPKSSLACLLPEPESSSGYIESDSNQWLGVYIGNTTIEEFNAYIDECLKAGFDIDHSRKSDALYAENQDGIYLKVFYEGNQTMHITVTDWEQ